MAIWGIEQLWSKERQSELMYRNGRVGTTKSALLRLDIKDSILVEVINSVLLVTDNRVCDSLTKSTSP